MRRDWLKAGSAGLLLAGTAGIGAVVSGCATPAGSGSGTSTAAAGGRTAAAAPVSAPDAPAAAAAPIIRVRERWVYDEINCYNGELNGRLKVEVTEANPNYRVRLQLDTRPQSLCEEIYHANWAVLRECHFDAPIQFDEPVPTLTRVLAPGAQERLVTYYRTDQSERRYRWQMAVDALGWERLAVPAGEFDCLRIVRRIWFTHFDFFRLNSERIDTLWYAPRVNRWVQREWTGQYTIPGGRRGTRGREDWVRWQLREHIAAPVSAG